ncbi:MAG TPA: tetratricopeptide repeat protein [Terriglobia bacterium]|nr:tetratricopeptide repeat protein [Terriglobia bacterium]
MKSMSARKILGVFVAFAALAVMAVPAYAQTGGIQGKAIQEDGQPCVKCVIVADRLDIKASYHTKTGKKGDFVYIGLPIGNYKITLQSPTGQTLFYIEKHVGLGEPTEVNFDLPKEMAQEKQQRQEEMKKNPEMAKAAAESAKQEKEFKGLKQYFDQGNALYNQGQYKEAASMYEQALTLAKEKNVPVVLSRLADAYAKAKENDKAVETYDKALQLTPDDAALHNNLGSVYASTGKLPEAQAEFEKAATIDPTNAGRYYFNIGAIMYNSGKMDEALAAFKKVISLDPKNADAYYLEGQALMGKATMSADGKVKAPDGTVEAFQQYLELNPNGPNAEAAKQMIATLQGTVATQYKKQKK